MVLSVAAPFLLALLALDKQSKRDTKRVRHHRLPPGIVRICNADKCTRFPHENNCSAAPGSSTQWQPSHRYSYQSKSDGAQHEGAWTRCLFTGTRPLCGRKGAPGELNWDRRKSLQLVIERESEQHRNTMSLIVGLIMIDLTHSTL